MKPDHPWKGPYAGVYCPQCIAKRGADERRRRACDHPHMEEHCECLWCPDCCRSFDLPEAGA